MEMVSKVSKGSIMDQIYLPKKRASLPVGSYVVVSPLTTKREGRKLYYHHVHSLEPIKVALMHQIFDIIKNQGECDNIIITGSFLEKGFRFNDVDILVITENTVNKQVLEKKLENMLNIQVQILALSFDALLQGVATDPLYELMLDKYVAKRRIIYRVKRRCNYKVLDLHLLKSKTLMENFDHLSGREKYYWVRNTVAIFLFLTNKKVTMHAIENEIEKTLNTSAIKVKENMLNKKEFLRKFKEYYAKTFEKVSRGFDAE